MKTCCACGLVYRFNKKVNNISFHKFPQDETARKAWCNAVKPNFLPSKSSVLCSKHFQEDCFFYPPGGMKQRIYLKPGSLPTVFGFRSTKKSNMRVTTDLEKKIQQENNEMIEEDISVSTDSEHLLSEMDMDQVEIIMDTDQVESAMDTDQVKSVMDIKQVEMAPLVHDIQSEEIVDKEDNTNDYPVIPKRKKSRRYNPRFVGDCDPEDLKSPTTALRNWNLAVSYIETQRKKIRDLQQQNRRLHRKVTDLKILLFRLKNKDLISKHAKKLLSMIQDTDGYNGDLAKEKN